MQGLKCDIFSIFLPIKYELKTPSVEMACDLGIQNEIQAVCNGINKQEVT